MRHVLRRTLSLAAAALLLLTTIGPAAAETPKIKIPGAAAASVDLSGTWSCDDGGTYYVTQRSQQLFWFGESADGGKAWSNIFHADLSRTGSQDGSVRVGKQIGGAWTDVPKGGARNSGALFLVVDSADAFHIQKEALGRQNFSGRTFKRTN